MALYNAFHMWIVLLVVATFSNLSWSACPGNWLPILTESNPSIACYLLNPDLRRDFSEADQYCQAQGGYLARDTSQTVHNALKPYIISAAKSATRPSAFWIGLTDNNVTNGQWTWLRGPALANYTNFAYPNVTNAPNKQECFYVSTSDPNLKWLVGDCNSYYAFVCQRDSNASSNVVVTTTSPLNCPAGWYGYRAGNTCIRLYPASPKTWTDARAFCKNMSGDLVKIGNVGFNNFVNLLVNGQKGVYWIGLNDRAHEGTFVWLDETVQTNFTFWNRGMPNNVGGNENCVAINSSYNMYWDDDDCSLTNRFICQTNPAAGTPAPNTVSTPSHKNCGTDWEDVPNSDNCYRISTNLLSWLDAHDDCKTAGGDLASINSVQEQFYLVGRTLTLSASFYWIGANDRNTENGWQWTDGSPFAFLNWDDKQPDNSQNSDCVAFDQQTGRWNDLPCQNRYAYVCKKKGRVTLPSLITTTTTPGNLPGDVIFGCPTGWSGFRGSCYKVVVAPQGGVDWATATASCSGTNMGALAAIIDDSENKFITSLLPRGISGYAWIGLQDPQKNTFTWSDGTPVQYTNWDRGEPSNANNQDCVVMKTRNGKWNDIRCSAPANMFVCKKSKSILPNNDYNENQGCQNNSFGYGARCFRFIRSGKNFTNAQMDCKSRSGNLATIDSGHLQAYLSAQLSTLPGPMYWIGLSQSGSTYNWQTNWAVSFTYWSNNHTGNERFTCVAMQQANPAGLWWNYPCSKVMPYVCELPRAGYTTQSTQTPVTMTTLCSAGWLNYNNICYRAYSGDASRRLSWTDARDFCANQGNGGTLVTIKDNVTQAWLITNVIRSTFMQSTYWIGLNDRATESGYVWSDNSPYLFSNWALNEPNDNMNREDCVQWVLPSNAWNDAYCYSANYWICQLPAGAAAVTTLPPPTGAISSQCGNATWQLYNNNCYYVSPNYGTNALLSWFNARQKCMDLGADLASISAEEENGFITSLVGKTHYYTFWIGLNDLDRDTYAWTDQSPVGYAAWGTNEPNDNYGEERCVEITTSGLWNDDQCQTLNGYVCKKRPGNYSPSPNIPTVPTGGCPRNFVSLPALDFCYFIGGTTNTTRKNYTDAMEACQEMDHKPLLASIHTTLEEKFILVLLSNSMFPAWIGFNDRRIRNRFEWVDNLVVSYTNWGPGQPDENLKDPSADARRDCVDVEIRRNPGTWNDRSCNTALAYVCETRKGSTFPTSAPNTTGCNAGYQRFHNSCYKYFDESLNWTSASNMCQADGGNLASLSSGVDQAFVEILAGSTEIVQFWIGLQYVMLTASFSWSDGWPVTFTNWGKNEPKLQAGQSCVSHTVDGYWQVAPCNMEFPFVCEVHFGSPPPARPFFNNPGRCPDNTWLNNGGYCYHIETSSPVIWSQAVAACKMMGANLTSIHSDRESRYLTNIIGTAAKDVWIGLSKGRNTSFAWNDHTELEYIYWGSGEPSDPLGYLHQDCVKIVSRYGTWADTDCGDKNAYICKMAQRPRPSLGPNATYPSRGPGRRTYSGYTGSYRPHWGSSGRPFRGSSGQPYRRSSTPTNVVTANQKGTNASGLSGGATAGVVIGSLVLVAIIAVIGFLIYRYTRGQNIPIFRAQRLNDSETSGFANASYSSDQENKVNITKDNSDA